MTSAGAALRAHLARRIAVDGPLSVADVMRTALTHPEYGYYTTRDPFGGSGDFITAPEISQMFGELIGLWAAVVWQSMGSPAPFALAELGPGRGTLMADALRAAARVPGFEHAVEVHLVEASPVLRKAQAKALEPRLPIWHDSTVDLPDLPTIVVANEFFDALPIVQLVRRDSEWRERRVGVTEAGDGLAWTETPGPSAHQRLIPERLRLSAEDGALFEISPDSLSGVQDIAARLVRFGGAALAIDYGHTVSGVGDTLQAVRVHRYADVLGTLGEADLTAHVDFEALARTASQAGAVCLAPTTQRDFLRSLGVEARANALTASATAEQAEEIRSALHRLIDPSEMGTLFKVMAWTSPGLPPPPGFERPMST